MPTPGILEYPTALDTAVSLCELKNNASATLTSGINSSVLLIPVSQISEFPNSGFATLTDSLTSPTTFEIFRYTSKSGSDLVVPSGGRGQDGTTAAAFSTGAAVEQRPTARLWTVLADAIIAIQTKLGIGSDTPALGQSLFSDAAGSSLWLGGAVRRIRIDLSQVGNIGGGTDDLMTFTVPADTLAADGDSLLIFAAGKNAATASDRTVTPVYAGNNLDSRTANFNAPGTWSAVATIFRTSATALLYRSRIGIWNSGSNVPVVDFKGENTISGGGFAHSNANIFKMTGNSVAANNNDITQTSLQIFKVSA